MLHRGFTASRAAPAQVGGRASLGIMELYSLQFVLFLCAALAAYYVVGRVRAGAQWIILLVASMGFYLASGWQNLFFIVATALSCWLAGTRFGALDAQAKEARRGLRDRAEKKAVKQRFQRRKRVVLLLALALNLGVLAYIKYWNALLAALGSPDSPLACRLLLPLGLSFYTFQSLSYVIDTYNGKVEPERNPARYLLFVSWFPQLIQGPINRYDALAPQLLGTHAPQAERSWRALLLLSFGLMKKYAIANALAPSVSACLDRITPGTPGSVVAFGILLYSAQQYTDFSGGIDMVRAVSELFGIEMAVNFRQPYFATSLGDFWRRWHISLGAWMRDYVFYPLALTAPLQRLGKWAGARLGRHMGRTLPASLANVVVFLLVGLWHGPEPHYLLWGLYNGLVIALADLTAPLSKRALEALRIQADGAAWHLVRVVRTFVVVNVGWYFDRIADPAQCAIGLHNTLFSFAPELLAPGYASLDVTDALKCLALAGFACALVFCVSLLAERGHDVGGALLARPFALRMLALVVMGLCTLMGFVLAPATGGFLYANF